MKKFYSTVLFFVFVFFSYAQEAVVTAGGDVENGVGSVSYSIGQVFYLTIEDDEFSVSQGIQQAYDVDVLSTDELSFVIDLMVYPNPTTDILNLEVSDFTSSKMNYQLYDAQGKLVGNEVINSEVTQLSMSHLPTSSYLLHVQQEGKTVKTFRVVKH